MNSYQILLKVKIVFLNAQSALLNFVADSIRAPQNFWPSNFHA